MTKIFITGATGRLAHYAIDFLKGFAPEAQLFGLVREEKCEAAQALQARGVETRVGDYSDKESLVKAFEGMDRLLFISFPNTEWSANVVAAAKEAGISFIAYTSVNGIDHNKNGLEFNHRATEEAIRQSGIAHTFLRNSWYLEMEIGPFNAALATGNYYYLGDGVISYSPRQTYAEAAARVAATPDYPEVLELGRTAFSHKELAKALEEASGKTLNIQQVDKATYLAHLEPYAESGFEVGMQEYVAAGNNGENDVTPDDLERVLGRPLPSLAEVVKAVITQDEMEFRRPGDKNFKGYK